MEIRVEKTDSFLCNCKLLYFLSAIPGQAGDLEEYQRLVSIAKTYFLASEYEHISEYLHLYKYQTNIWAAYLIIQYGSPDSRLEALCKGILKNSERFLNF